MLDWPGKLHTISGKCLILIGDVQFDRYDGLPCKEVWKDAYQMALWGMMGSQGIAESVVSVFTLVFQLILKLTLLLVTGKTGQTGQDTLLSITAKV